MLRQLKNRLVVRMRVHYIGRRTRLNRLVAKESFSHAYTAVDNRVAGGRAAADCTCAGITVTGSSISNMRATGLPRPGRRLRLVLRGCWTDGTSRWIRQTWRRELDLGREHSSVDGRDDRRPIRNPARS